MNAQISIGTIRKSASSSSCVSITYIAIIISFISTSIILVNLNAIRKSAPFILPSYHFIVVTMSGSPCLHFITCVIFISVVIVMISAMSMIMIYDSARTWRMLSMAFAAFTITAVTLFTAFFRMLTFLL